MKNTLAILLVTFTAASAGAAAKRTFVSALLGSDANAASGCSIVSPCRTFAAALPIMSSYGEIIALDSAGYGPVTIDKSVTIIGPPGIYAGVTAPAGGTAVTVNIGANDVVSLRGLTLSGDSATGVRGGEGLLSIENCRFLGLAYGVRFAGAGRFQISGSSFIDNVEGVYATASPALPATGQVVTSLFFGSAGASIHAGIGARIDVSDSSAFDGTAGVLASEGGTISCTRCTIGRQTTAGAEATGTGSVARLNRCVITRNNTGVATFNGGVFESRLNNVIRDNIVADIDATKVIVGSY